MKPGDILCLENTRFHPGEERNDPGFVAQLAALGGRQGNRWMQVERNVERLRALEDRPKPLVVEKDIVGEAMDEHFRIAHAFDTNEERRQYISAFAE
jgi:Phosphoglycerate kinase